jgi:hypothetical protein
MNANGEPEGTSQLAAAVSAIRRAQVEKIRPFLLRDTGVADYFSVSASTVRAWRAAALAAKMRGEDPAKYSPKWLLLNRSIFYRLDELEAWVNAFAVEYGVVAYSDRGHPPGKTP